MDLNDSAARGAALLAALSARLSRQHFNTTAGSQAGIHQHATPLHHTAPRHVAAPARDPVPQAIPPVPQPRAPRSRVRFTAVLPVTVAHTPPSQWPRAQRCGLPAHDGAIALGSGLLAFASVASIPLGPVPAPAVDASVLRQLAPVPRAIVALGEVLRALVRIYFEAATGAW